ncbi:MAG: phosphogluconate dehydratase [Oceanospirillaceae bacterium]|nr:phosphogluconate dehydratase [Oceanospirillaceae bacterium]MCP5335324.1 phosphogluconate dehydratase [Oceanospirillaceae bacterium]MCP5350723.1 phosphogluconate dehydratase [Oceanospirillaceae bacterium]
MHTQISEITRQIRERSQSTRDAYLQLIRSQRQQQPNRHQLGCTNLAHVMASADDAEKVILKSGQKANIGIITAYNDMLSAHQPYYRYPELLKAQLYLHGLSAQVAAGVPAMCDGVTQGYAGMELSLFSRDVIALSTAVGLSHQAFDGVLYLGICDKIVPGLLMAALRFGHLPALFIPAGPMPSGISNAEKSKVRQAYASGSASADDLLNSEMAAYHSAGTCTFYGTANSNQMLLEAMGLMLPGAAFVHPQDELRNLFNSAACERMAAIHALASTALPIGELVDEKVIVNALVMLLATGGSTNLTIHWIAVARAAGILINWQDMHALSALVPLLTRIYPNGAADINQFHQAGGVAYVIAQLMDAGLLHADVKTVAGDGLQRYGLYPQLQQNQLVYQSAFNQAADILATHQNPFAKEGGIKCLRGNLGEAIIKISAVEKKHWYVQAPACVFTDQAEVLAAFTRGELNKNCIIVLQFQGPRANGMPELHKLMPALGVLQDRGFKVALLTDGRLSGASGKVPAAIHVTPEAACGGMIAKIRDGDLITLDATKGTLILHNVNLQSREPALAPVAVMGVGREMFNIFRRNAGPANEGAISIQWD